MGLDYRKTTQHCSNGMIETHRAVQSSAMRSIDAYHNTHPETTNTGQVNNTVVPEDYRIDIDHDDESNKFDAYEHVQIAEGQLCSPNVDPKPASDFRILPTSTFNNNTNTNQSCPVVPYARNQSLESVLNCSNNYCLPSSASPAKAGMRYRFDGLDEIIYNPGNYSYYSLADDYPVFHVTAITMPSKFSSSGYNGFRSS